MRLGRGAFGGEFWEASVALADAKAWHVSLDRPALVNARREYPPEQIEWYLNNSRLDYAILTNGKLWRLIPREHDAGQPRFQTYLECELPKLLDDRLAHEDVFPHAWDGFGDSLRFYLFFSPVALRATVIVRRWCSGHAAAAPNTGSASGGLKHGSSTPWAFASRAFSRMGPMSYRPFATSSQCRQESLILLYRLLFILFAEDRKLLPFGSIAPIPTTARWGASARYRRRLDHIREGREPDYPPQDTGIWGRSALAV